MSGLVTETKQKGRGSGLSQGFTFRRFTTTGDTTIAKPYGCTMIIIECIGGGGGGGGGEGNNNVRDGGGGGGGGGAISRMSFPAESLGETLTITVGAGGASAAGGSSAAGTNGNYGLTTSVTDHGVAGVSDDKIILSAYGGGGGDGAGDGDVGGSGGGGGGTGAVGTSGTAYNAKNAGGSPFLATATAGEDRLGGGGGGGNANRGNGYQAEFGGGGGGGGSDSSSGGAAGTGGSSLFGAGAGGGGGGAEDPDVGANGGAWGSYATGVPPTLELVAHLAQAVVAKLGFGPTDEWINSKKPSRAKWAGRTEGRLPAHHNICFTWVDEAC
jgi:hypothetical protein